MINVREREKVALKKKPNIEKKTDGKKLLNYVNVDKLRNCTLSAFQLECDAII